jgi:hypothetical protein
MDNPLPDFNMLVRDAFDAQDAFDQWDDGKTIGDFFVAGQRTMREVDLDTVTREWDEANRKLIEYVLEHGEKLLEMKRVDAR